MPHLYLAPATAGKTAWTVATLRRAAAGLARTPVAVVATPLQARALRARLAEAGGAIGVRVLTFDALYVMLLARCGEVYTELRDPVRFRLLRILTQAAAERAALPVYGPLADLPGFIASVQALIDLFKGARISPEQLKAALATARLAASDRARLAELAELYARYQAALQANGWSDRAGMGWLALDKLQDGCLAWPAEWSPLVFDGFADFTQVQLAVIAALAQQAPDLAVTLTGALDATGRLAPGRTRQWQFAQTAHGLFRALGVAAEPLPPLAGPLPARAPALTWLGEVFARAPQPAVAREPRPASTAGVTLVEATNRTAEVRAALRWLKQRIVEDGCRPEETALLARSLLPYRETTLQVAAEFGLAVHAVDGLALRQNPAIDALLGLLRLSLPGESGGQAMPRRELLAAWRSPYFDWAGTATPAPDTASTGPGISAIHADRLAQVARSAHVMRSEARWRAALARLAARPATAPSTEPGAEPGAVPGAEPAQAMAADRGEDAQPALDPAAAQELLEKFDRFAALLAPPPEATTFAAHVRRLETLIGDDPLSAAPPSPDAAQPFSLNLVARIRSGPPDLAARDLAALHALKEILRGLVWAEATIADPTHAEPRVSFAAFLAELAGAIQVAAYHPPQPPQAVLLAATPDARGLPLRAVAVVGLAEGELPSRVGEDPLLRDADRTALRAEGLPLDASTRSNEAELFYDTVTRPHQWLLLTRPRLADDGSEWEPSPYWTEIKALLGVEPEQVRAGQRVQPASPVELVRLLAQPGDAEPLPSAATELAARAWLQRAYPGRLARVAHGAAILAQRSHKAASPYDGDLAARAPALAARFGPDRVWSPSRLEKQLTCGFYFLVDGVLRLEAQALPEAGMTAAQRGSLLHALLERTYATATDPANLDDLLAALDSVAPALLAAAPDTLGFEPAAWWEQERSAIMELVRTNLAALHKAAGDFRPLRFEVPFGRAGSAALELPLAQADGSTAMLRLRGVIDRIDQDPAGRLRIIDYKSGGKSGYADSAVKRDRRIQLAIYAQAAHEALKLGEVIEGYYWSLRDAEPGGFQLARLDGGPAAAMHSAARLAIDAVTAIRSGQFAPSPPALGCPDHCPAAGFCPRYRPGFG